MNDPLDAAAFAQTIELVGGDRAFLADLVATYRRDAAQRLVEMRAALASGAAPELQRAAHTLKSSSATLGAVHLADLCRDAEYRARDGALEGLGVAIDEIARELAAVERALEERLGAAP